MEETAPAFFAGLDGAGAPRDLVALGGRLDVDTLLAAYRSGCFPWPASGADVAPLDRDARRLARRGDVPVLPGTDFAVPLMPWVSPHPRPVMGRHPRSEEHTSELQSRQYLVCRLLLEKKKTEN